VTVVVSHADGSEDRIDCKHTLSELQIAWYRAGSALNYLREQNREGTAV
jgi:aconitate hydratase